MEKCKARVHFSAKTLQIPASLADRSRTVAWTSSENSFDPFKNWLVGPVRPNRWM